MFKKNSIHWRLLLVLMLTLILSACTNGQSANNEEVQPISASQSAITLDELPTGLGRGYPIARVIPDSNATLVRGETAPDFRIQLTDGRALQLSDLQGSPVMINFWATWCGPCRLEMPEIISHAEDHPELIVLAVNTQEELELVQPFAEEFGMPMPVLLDDTGDIRKLYDVRGMPTTVFIDREGKLIQQWSGLLTSEMLTKLLGDIL